VITTAMIGACLSTTKISDLIQAAQRNIAMRASFAPVPGSPGNYAAPGWTNFSWTLTEMKMQYPLPLESQFWRVAFRSRYYSTGYANISFVWFLIFFAWPWLTLVTLIIFRISMRQAKIRRVHLVRSVLYSCDFGILLGLTLWAISLLNANLSEGWIMVCSGLLCTMVTTYRLTIAFRQYLRVHLPFATVIASQIIALLIVFLLLVQIADFSRRV
jgi:hypothetical protein